MLLGIIVQAHDLPENFFILISQSDDSYVGAQLRSKGCVCASFLSFSKVCFFDAKRLVFSEGHLLLRQGCLGLFLFLTYLEKMKNEKVSSCRPQRKQKRSEIAPSCSQRVLKSLFSDILLAVSRSKNGGHLGGVSRVPTFRRSGCSATAGTLKGKEKKNV